MTNKPRTTVVQDPDHLLIDRITYLASLASVRSAIDAMLEILRQVTSRLGPDRKLGSEERQRLLELEANLKQYLLTQDPLRSFTSESLEVQIRNYARDRMRQNQFHVNGFLAATLISILLCSLAFIIPPVDMPLSLRITLAVPFLFIGIQTATAWFFLSSLKNFKPELRRAFFYMCGGTVMFGILYPVLAFINYFELYKDGILSYTGLPGVIPAIGFVLMYLGLRRYAQLVGAKSRAGSLRLSLGGYAALVLIAILIPHAAVIPPGEEAYFDLSLVADLSFAFFACVGALLARQILKTANTPYVKPFRLLKWYLIFITLTATGGAIGLWMTGPFLGANFNLTLAFTGIPPELLLLYTGYAFNRGMTH